MASVTVPYHAGGFKANIQTYVCLTPNLMFITKHVIMKKPLLITHLS